MKIITDVLRNRENLKKNANIPTICMQCKWYHVLGCMYNGELRKSFNPGIKCFKPKNDPSYPDPKNIVNQFFNICYKSFSKLEHEFTTKEGESEDGTKFLSILSDNIRILEKFKIEFLALQKEFHKYHQTNKKKEF